MAEVEAFPVSATDKAVAHLRRLLGSGRLRPGERLKEQELSSEIGVSRTPLREALKLLAQEGLVEVLPNRGARVPLVSEAEIDDLFPVMGALEGLAGTRAAAKASDADIDDVWALHYQMAAAWRRRDRATYHRLNREIHDHLLRLADSPTLTRLHGALDARVAGIRFEAETDGALWDRAMAEHEDMLKALEARDGPALGAVLQRHLETKRETVLAALQEGLAAAGDGKRPA